MAADGTSHQAKPSGAQPGGTTRRNMLLGATALGTAAASGAAPVKVAQAQEVLPRPEQPFRGSIGRTARDSKPDFPQPVEAPKGAPKVLLILTDDVGFGAS